MLNRKAALLIAIACLTFAATGCAEDLPPYRPWYDDDEWGETGEEEEDAAGLPGEWPMPAPEDEEEGDESDDELFDEEGEEEDGGHSDSGEEEDESKHGEEQGGQEEEDDRADGEREPEGDGDRPEDESEDAP